MYWKQHLLPCKLLLLFLQEKKYLRYVILPISGYLMRCSYQWLLVQSMTQ